MIIISGNLANTEELIKQYADNRVKKKTIRILSDSSVPYRYTSSEQFDFELDLRSNIVDAAVALYRSNLAFTVFRESFCNKDYWERTEEGGFKLLAGVSPSEAIRDIYLNSSEYGTECATAMVIIFYKALAELFPEALFDKIYSSIYLMDWQYTDRNLALVNLRQAPDYLPGDCRYIKNPDVDPLKPELQGENIIDLGNDTYYGHGFGINTIDKFIEVLNENRKEGSEISAFLMDQATRMDISYLFKLFSG